MALHKTLPITEVHTPISFQYADATARTGATGFTSNDLFKFAHQQDNDTIWMLTATTPTWAEITSTGNRAITNKIDLPATKNTTGSIGVGKLVYIISHDDPNTAVKVELAKADSETTMGTIGVVIEALTDSTVGTIRIIGKVDSAVDTSSFSAGDELFISAATAGELTNVKPTGPNKVQHVGRVLKVGASDGIVYITAVGVILDLSDADPQNLGSSADSGTSPKFSREDHVHLHGFLSHPSHHALATTSAHGFMSSTDKAILDSVGSGNVLLQVRNESGSTITKGKAVYASGFSVTEDIVLIGLADKDTQSKRPALGLVVDDIANNANGETMITGTLEGVDTSAFALTDQLVLGSNGALSRPPPTEDPFTGEVQNLGSPTRIDATNGSITVSLDGLDPTTGDQVFALAGTDGTPGPTNKYVTDSDPRLLRQTVFEEITADTTTTSSTYVDLLTLNITTSAGGILLIHASVSMTNTIKDVANSMQVLVDGTPKRGATIGIGTAGLGGDASVALRVTGLTAGAHTVKIQWKTQGGTARIRPVGVDDEHASLLVQEVAV